MGRWLKSALAFVWSGWGNFTWLAGLVSFTAVAAVAARATGVMAPYAPLSWVGAGGVAFLLYAIGTWLYGIGRTQIVRSKYDDRLLAQGGAIDPLAKTFENKRIFLNEFALPSKPLIEHKTFIDCEIVGPANVILNIGNNVDNHRLPYCDAIVMHFGADPINGYIFNNCIFRGCSFIRVTLMFSLAEYEKAKDVNWLNWTSIRPDHPELATIPLVEHQKLIEGPVQKGKWSWKK